MTEALSSVDVLAATGKKMGRDHNFRQVVDIAPRQLKSTLFSISYAENALNCIFGTIDT